MKEESKILRALAENRLLVDNLLKLCEAEYLGQPKEGVFQLHDELLLASQRLTVLGIETETAPVVKADGRKRKAPSDNETESAAGGGDAVVDANGGGGAAAAAADIEEKVKLPIPEFLRGVIDSLTQNKQVPTQSIADRDVKNKLLMPYEPTYNMAGLKGLQRFVQDYPRRDDRVVELSETMESSSEAAARKRAEDVKRMGNSSATPQKKLGVKFLYHDNPAPGWTREVALQTRGKYRGETKITFIPPAYLDKGETPTRLT